MDNIRKYVLDNGVRIVLERIPHLRSASLGIWLDVGSRNEKDSESGLAHFIEHMYFKGTRTRNAQQLAIAMNRIGGNINAFTTQENICLSAKVVDEYLAHAIDLLAEIYFESVFAQQEIDRERNVIIEEVKMYEDTPDELVADNFLNHLYFGNPLGRPVLGTIENIERFGRDDIQTFAHREFAPDRILVTIAGNLDVRRVEPQLRRIFEPLNRNGWERNPILPPEPAYRAHNLDRKLEQVHFCMGTDAPGRCDDDRFAMSIMNMILGGGTSSRIFQEVREKRGLAYSIGSFQYMFKDSGCFAVSGGNSPRNTHKVLKICLDEIKRMYTELVTEEEIDSAREQIISSILLGMENSSNRMGHLADCELYFGEYVPLDTVIERIKAVTPADVRAMAEKYLKDRPVAFASIGPEKKFEPYLGGMTF